MEKQNGANVYEVSYLFLPSIAVEQIISKTVVLKNMLISFGAEIISDENPVLVDLAYAMTKVIHTTRHKVWAGYFGWIKFEISSEAVLSVKKALDTNDEIIRYLIVKTVRENTLLNGKMKLQKEDKVRRDEKLDEIENVLIEPVEEVVKETVPEELDKSIDDLVIV